MTHSARPLSYRICIIESGIALACLLVFNVAQTIISEVKGGKVQVIGICIDGQRRKSKGGFVKVDIATDNC